MTDTSVSNPFDFVWKARVTPETGDRAVIHVRQHRFVAGRPLDFDAESGTISALEYFLGALGADVLNGLQAVAKGRRLVLDHVEATVEGKLDNPLTHLGVVGEEGHPGLVQARVKMYASSPDPEESLRDAWAEALERSPIVRTLRDTVDLSLEFHLVA